MMTLASVEHCERSQAQPRPLERPANKLAHFGGIKQDFRHERNLFITNVWAGRFWSGLRTARAGPLLMAKQHPLKIAAWQQTIKFSVLLQMAEALSQLRHSMIGHAGTVAVLDSCVMTGTMSSSVFVDVLRAFTQSSILTFL
jgi:hypothetical protein